MRTFAKIGLALGSVLASMAMFGSGVASASIKTAYVAPNGTWQKTNNSCRNAGFNNINTAISQVSAGGTVVVCKGVYRTQAVIRKSLALIGRPGAVIDAKGQKPVPGLHLPGGSGVVVAMGVRLTLGGNEAAASNLPRRERQCGLARAAGLPSMAPEA